MLQALPVLERPAVPARLDLFWLDLSIAKTAELALLFPFPVQPLISGEDHPNKVRLLRLGMIAS